VLLDDLFVLFSMMFHCAFSNFPPPLVFNLRKAIGIAISITLNRPL